MLLGFKRRFAPYVEEGSKTHTIRGKRKIRPKVGDTCHCYVDPRQKSMRLIGRFQCVRVEEIEIKAPWQYHWSEVEIYVEGVRLSMDECNALAWRDGFRSRDRGNAFQEMVEFWQGRLPFYGDIIHWKFKQEGRS